jgi:hypothetical protein
MSNTNIKNAQEATVRLKQATEQLQKLLHEKRLTKLNKQVAIAEAHAANSFAAYLIGYHSNDTDTK